MSERASSSETSIIHRKRRTTWFCGVNLREALFIALCALLLVATTIFFRFRLGLPGHRVFFLAFSLIVARALVDRAFAATITGLMAAFVMMALGLGRMGPLVLLQYLVPGLLVDALAALGLTRFMLGGALLGIAAGLGRAPAQVVGDLLVGIELNVALLSRALRLIPAMLFGAVGGVAAVFVAERLRAAGMAPPGRTTQK